MGIARMMYVTVMKVELAMIAVKKT